MADNACTHHIKINIHKTPKKMIPFLYGRCVIAILPKGSFVEDPDLSGRFFL